MFKTNFLQIGLFLIVTIIISYIIKLVIFYAIFDDIFINLWRKPVKLWAW